MNRLDELTIPTTLVVEACVVCGVMFGLTNLHAAGLRRSNDTFHCPNGHPQHYTAKNDRDRAREAEEKLARERAKFDQDLAFARDQRDRASRRASAAKGQVTRIRNRVAGGVCPCCNRTFENLARHMAGQHPGWQS